MKVALLVVAHAYFYGNTAGYEFESVTAACQGHAVA
jgi:hypothetical protein